MRSHSEPLNGQSIRGRRSIGTRMRWQTRSIIETYAECVRDKTAAGVRFAFVTHNKSEFSVENGQSQDATLRSCGFLLAHKVALLH